MCLLSNSGTPLQAYCSALRPTASQDCQCHCFLHFFRMAPVPMQQLAAYFSMVLWLCRGAAPCLAAFVFMHPIIASRFYARSHDSFSHHTLLIFVYEHCSNARRFHSSAIMRKKLPGAHSESALFQQSLVIFSIGNAAMSSPRRCRAIQDKMRRGGRQLPELQNALIMQG